MFREDLFFRINAISISLPPLRERTEDIPLLVSEFIRRLQKKTGKPIRGLTRSAMERFMVYPWPGNVREFKSALDYAFILAEEGLDRATSPAGPHNESSRFAAGNCCLAPGPP